MSCRLSSQSLLSEDPNQNQNPRKNKTTCVIVKEEGQKEEKQGKKRKSLVASFTSLTSRHRLTGFSKSPDSRDKSLLSRMMQMISEAEAEAASRSRKLKQKVILLPTAYRFYLLPPESCRTLGIRISIYIIFIYVLLLCDVQNLRTLFFNTYLVILIMLCCVVSTLDSRLSTLNSQLCSGVKWDGIVS